MPENVRNQIVIIDQDELELFCQASTVKKGSKRAIKHPETLALRNVRRKLDL
ncbi:hypothetical protein TSAR_003569 [Trichomalopsis sarcophagae]|uniref:Uncharacterized protein n=1 Tax=Trichomalopsis sarcophagae TaxID=543379 RepID=A0A232FDC0_9HYME|nr:hypothetical protein TSAR_003569 [Trichomalopsis sarcophagae]